MNKSKIHNAFNAVKKDIEGLNQKNFLIEKKISDSFQAMKKDINALKSNNKTEKLIDSLKTEILELKNQIQKNRTESTSNFNGIPKEISDKLSKMDLLVAHINNLKKEKSEAEKESKKLKKEIETVENKRKESEYKLISTLKQQSEDFLKRENDVVKSLRGHYDKLFLDSEKKSKDNLEYYEKRLEEERAESRRKIDEIKEEYKKQENKLNFFLSQQSENFLKRENDVVKSLRGHYDKLFLNSEKKSKNNLEYYEKKLEEEREDFKKKINEIKNNYEEKLEKTKKQEGLIPRGSLKKSKTQKKDLNDEGKISNLENTLPEKEESEAEKEKQIIFGNEMLIKNLKINKREGLFSKLVNKLSDD